MWCVKLILVSCIALVSSRPQSQQQVESTTGRPEPQEIEIERQIIQEVEPVGNSQTHSALRRMEDSTKEILEKIAEVNKKQGLVRKKYTPSYFHFPFSYSRAQNDGSRSNNFNFPQNPFANPIFEYLANEQGAKGSFRRPNFDREYSDGSESSVTNSEDNIPGQYIKRKITHYQSVLMPNPLMVNPTPSGSMPMSPFSPVQGYPNFQTYPVYPTMFPPASLETPKTSGGNKNRTSVAEEQTIENIKNIITANQGLPNALFPNYQAPQMPFHFPNTNLNPYQSPGNHQVQPNKARQNWNWPGAGFFPIYIRDPFLQMYYAVTNMIEYGPSAGSDGPCKLTPRPQGSRVKINSKAASGTGNSGHQVTLEMNKKEGVDEITVAEVIGAAPDDDDIRYLDVEDIDLGDDDLIKFTINLPSTEGRGLKGNVKYEKMGWDEYVKLRNKTALAHLVSDKLDFTSMAESKQSPPIKEQTLHIQELEDDPTEADKAEDITISNQGSKKVFSKDNTGNGIFIHKLKVRKGGVAIAGPGGIATAGSGGTAIVGPNGVAYTHPDGLAIAGSGTKVVAVDPSIDLNEVIKDTVLNGTRHVPNTRVGKVVAVGPVVYYNRGDTTRITLIPYYGGLKGQSLQITENSKGEIISATVVKTPNFQPSESEQTEIEINPSELENPPLPSKYDTEQFEGYDEYIRNIQNRAMEIVKLQEKAKRNGDLTEEEQNTYKQHMKSINESAQKLAAAQENTGLLFENREGLSHWFERKKETSKDKNKKKDEDKKRKKEEEEKKKKEEEEKKKKKKKEEKENQKEEESEKEEEEEEDDNEGVAINLPPEDASVAEAKPIGLAIAGEGGVAASKPIATAVVGPAGLAIARPVATAIAGVSPDQALVPIYAEGLSPGSNKNKPKNKSDQMSEFLNKIISKYHQA